MRNLSRRLDALEAQAGITDNTVQIVGIYIRADGTQYEQRYTTDRAMVAYCDQEFYAIIDHRVAQLDGQPIDVANASILDLMATGHYAAVVQRVDTWFEHTSADLPAQFVELATQLRVYLQQQGEPV